MGGPAHCPERGFGTPKGQEVIPQSQFENKRLKNRTKKGAGKILENGGTGAGHG